MTHPPSSNASPSTESLSAYLRPHAERMEQTHLRHLFDQDGDRFKTFSHQAAGLLVDWSKEKLDAEVWSALLDYAARVDVQAHRDQQLAGHITNPTEGRAVLHTALRGGRWAPEGIRNDIAAERSKFLAFAQAVRSGSCPASNGEPFTDIVNIGIGGSDLGPAMAVRALAPFCDGPNIHFLSNVDGAHAVDLLGGLDAERTMIIIASKTFTTVETLTNATTAKAWLEATLGTRAGAHMAAISTNLSATSAFGIDPSKVFGFWDYVGGRYSIWSAIGLPLAIAIGADAFTAFLGGAQAIDDHFAQAPLEQNLPVILGLVGVWRRNGLGLSAHAVIPYEERLSRFPAYLQQLDMESNGKQVRVDGSPVPDATGMLVFGEPGTNSQHSFFQLCHQGTDPIALDVLFGRSSVGELVPGRSQTHHQQLLANALAQTRALAFGRTLEETKQEMRQAGMADTEVERLAPHRTFQGDRPSTTLVYDQLDPSTLGKLIALYEHKVFVESVLWGINAYDQWGVELGKQLAKQIAPTLANPSLDPAFDASTNGLLAALHQPIGERS